MLGMAEEWEDLAALQTAAEHVLQVLVQPRLIPSD
jgi:hypothetical protein